MSEGATIVPALNVRQLNLIARTYRISSRRSLADVSNSDVQWLAKWHQRGRNVEALVDKNSAQTLKGPFVRQGSPAAAVPWEAHQLDVILLRNETLLQLPEFSPELMIALANLGSSLKRSGRLLIPVTEPAGSGCDRWEKMLAAFPGKLRVRTLKPGLRGLLTLAFLFARNSTVHLVEFRVDRKLISRLEWHRLAREAVLSRLHPPAAA